MPCTSTTQAISSIHEQVATFSVFGKMIKWGSQVIASGLLGRWCCGSA